LILFDKRGTGLSDRLPIADLALAFQHALKLRNGQDDLSLRVGIDTGPVVAGVIGLKQVRLRPLGRHGEHGQPDRVARPARRYPGDREDI
jgi:hypothetical protein